MTKLHRIKSASNLSNHINIGRVTEAKLIQVGIDSYDKLVMSGSKSAFIRIQTIDPGACLSLLYGLEGAIEGIRWDKLPSEKKKALQHFYKITKRK